jgi:translocation and assembly module TamB
MASKKKLGWIALIVVIIVASLTLVGFVTLRSRWFHGFLLSKIQQQASEAIGGQVEINNFNFHLSALTADAYGIVIHGTEAAGTQPLLTADQLTVRLKIVSFLKKKVDLNEIILRHPVARVRTKKDGMTNLPTPPKKNNSQSTDLFDLGIRHVLLTGGEVYYNDVKTPVNADLHDLQLEVKSAIAGDRYDGSLSYRDGHLEYGTLKPLPHELSASFTASRNEFQFKPLILRVARSSFQLDGTLHDFSNPRAEGKYRIAVYPQDFRSALSSASLPSGEVSLTGGLRYQYEPAIPMLRSVVMDGQMASRELVVDSPQLHTKLSNLRGQFQLANGNLQAHHIAVELLGGRVTADLNMRKLDSTPVSKAQASLEAISLDGMKSALRSGNIRQLPVSGTVTGTADASWVGSIQTLRARSDFTLRGAIKSAQMGATTVPLNGAVHVTYDGPSGVVGITNTLLTTPATRIAVNGTAGQRLNLNLQARAADLRELDSLVAALKNASAGTSAGAKKNASTVNLAGMADLQASVTGTKESPQIKGRIAGHNLQYANSKWQSLRGDLQATKSGVSLQNGSLVNARQGYVAFALSVGLSDWNYLSSGPLNVQLTSRGLAIAQLLQLANLNYPISGNLSADVSVRGSQLNPVGSGSVRLNQARVYGQPLKELSLTFNGNGSAVNSELNASTSAGNARLTGIIYPKTKAYEIQLTVPGIDLARLEPVQERNLQVAGLLTASASGHGTLDDPQLVAEMHIPKLQIRQAAVSEIKAELNVANKTANLTLNSEVAQSVIQARASVRLTDGYYTKATFDTRAIPIEGLVALYMPVKTNSPTGQIEMHGSLEGPLKNRDQLRAELVIPTLKASYQQLEIGNTRPIQVHYANSVVALEPTEIAGTDSRLQLQGQMPLRGNAPVTLTANGVVDMQLLKFFQSDLQSSGKLLLNVKGTKAGGRPVVQGQVRVQNVNLHTPDAPVGVENLNGTLDINNDQVRITQLTGKAGGGQISATGLIGYRPQLQMNVVLNAKSVRIRYQDAVRVVFDSGLNLVGNSSASTLDGKVTIDSLGFTQNFDLAGLASQFQTGTESTPSTSDLLNNMKLNVAVRSSTNLNLTSSTVNVQGRADLRVIGTAADPVIVGRTELSGGEIFLMNNRYQIQRGIIEFSNPARTEPVLNVVLTTTINQYNLSLNFVGPIDKMRTNYVSDPTLPTADIINLIARGETTEQAAASPSNFGASSLIAKGVASQVSGGIQKLAGLSSLSIDPTLGGNDPNPGARIAFQKRVTRSFLFTFATDVTSTQREIIQGEYQFNKRWSTSVTRDENGGFAIDGKYHTSF